ncbi:hypothetical protein K3G63_02255 [Hymenobacter sp. HSC-4F20]|uniref:hypothetical protein n=1 Tax=Hymenobacter sp. HSC-4F20 TaxID=2864135 RepID=UPI001C734B26|nr:hypothetical protein [Hymenobacter sp. HSC-4F20]MBX0289239.1 hypothetical protein [Hymenobacter sp. HSC-4F20]
MVKVLYIAGGVAVAVISSIFFVFTLGQRSASYELRLTLRDAAGNLLPRQRVQVWHRGSTPLEFRTDDNGLLQITQSESFGSSILGPHRPGAFTVGLAFPDLSPLFYQFPVERSGPVPYQVFNTYYDYNYTSWVGDFDAAHCVRTHIKYNTGKLQQAVTPTGGKVQRWQAAAELRHLGKQESIHAYALDLALQLSGVETYEPR